MKTIVVGDPHGKYEIVEKVLKNTTDNIVFVGDYVDSFDRNVRDQLKTITLVLEAIRTSDGRVKGLLGNHELSYFIGRGMKCSGYSRAMATLLEHDLKEDWDTLLDYCWIGDDILLSHAGVSQRLLTHLDKTLTEYLEEQQYFQIGRCRGGPDRAGGLFWCDWWTEFESVTDVTQVVGHSAYRPKGAFDGIVESNGDFNIDCLDRVEEVLVIDEQGLISIEKL